MNRIIGIDLGTSTSEVTYIKDGKPVIIPNSLGNPITPSVVHIGEDGSVLVGEPAVEYLLTRPDCTFMEVKRLTGSGDVLKAHGKEYLPEDIQAMLLRYLADCAESFIGETICRAVITVPAYFTEPQRRATANAGELAGLKVERILNEPTAAALDYGLKNIDGCSHILVYDLGGGTLDITVLELFEGVIDVAASSGNNRLGGKDFDEALMKSIANPTDKRDIMRLKKAAEECKIALSESESYEISLPFFGKGKKALEKTITRVDFEAMISDMVKSTLEPVKSALRDAKLSPSDIDIVLLVGGSTRIPLVKQTVAQNIIEPKTFVDPDLTVARGAAIQAGIIEGVIEGLVLTDVCPYTLGTSVIDEGVFSDRKRFDPIINRNVTIPVEKTKVYFPYRDYQKGVIIDVYQGESPDPDKNEMLGEIVLSGLPPAKADKSPIEVVFAYDMNGILQVRAKALNGGKSVEAKINTSGVAPKHINIDNWESVPEARRFRPVVRKVEKLIAAAATNDAGDDDDIDRVLGDMVLQLKQALVTDDMETAEELRDILMEMLG